jgi:predicted enzyme related to lactoylglutathione lyase
LFVARAESGIFIPEEDPMPRVVHFEIPAENASRAVEFYKSVFGWEIKDAGMPMPYFLATTGKEGTMGIDGAIMDKKGMTAQSVTNTIDVPSVDDFIKKITKAGGKQVTKKDTIPGVGDFCYCTDTEGNLFGILQPLPRQM